MKKGKVAILGMTLLLAGGAWACRRDRQEIRIGAVAPVSGEAASIGMATRMGYELAQAECAEGQAPAPGALGRISAAADRAALLTHGLMGFVRREAEELAPTDLAREVLDMEATLRLILPRSVDLTLEVPGSGHLLVWSSRTRLEQMLVNLVANARDAMPDGGLLAIRAAAEPGHALIEVADTGTGMAPEILEHIFELFFTTKPPGRGTGMGLPSLKAMVEEGGGRLEVASAPGQGSRFRIFLPIFTPS